MSGVVAVSVTSKPAARAPASSVSGAAMRIRTGRSRRVPHLMLGVVLVAVSAVGFLVFSLQSAGRVPVLGLARDVAAGQVLTSADLRVVHVAAGDGVGLVPAGELDQVVGRPVAVPRPAGALLAPADVGPAGFPPAGKALVAAAVKTGQFPPGLTTGAVVTVLLAPDSASATAGGQTQAFGALVESVTAQPSSADGSVIVTLLMDPGPATTVGAAAAGTVSLVQLAPTSAGS